MPLKDGLMYHHTCLMYVPYLVPVSRSLNHHCFAHKYIVSYRNSNSWVPDNVYGAVVVTMVTARVHPVHLMNAD